MKLVTVEQFLNFPDRVEEFNQKITCDKVDHLVVAAKCLKSMDDIKSMHPSIFKTKLTDGVIVKGVEKLKQERAEEKDKQEKAIQI